MKKNMLQIPKGKNKASDQEIKKIKANLGSNKNLNITILTKLLQELLTND